MSKNEGTRALEPTHHDNCESCPSRRSAFKNVVQYRAISNSNNMFHMR